jgi:hypothetical protein
MLAAIEAHFQRAIRQACPEGTAVTAGPSRGPAGDGAELIEIVACRLSVDPLTEDKLTDARRPAYFTRAQRFSADGATRDFSLATSENEEIVEVESPAGRPARRDDDYRVDGSIVRFYRPPARADVAVVVRVRGAPARGFSEWRPCRIDVAVHLWAKELRRADELLSLAVGSALVAAAELGTMEEPNAGHPAVSLRLVRPVATLTGLARTLETASGASYQHGCIDLTLRGDLVQIVALGEPAPEDVIREVRPGG